MTKRKVNKEFQIRDIWHSQLRLSKKRGYFPPQYTKQQLIDWCLAQPLYHTLHANWVSSGFQRNLAPSIDRKDDYQPYSLTNIQLMTAEQNLQKSFRDTVNGVLNKRSYAVIQRNLDGSFVAQHASMNIAGRSVGAINGSMVSAVCNGLRATAHGYLWEKI